MFPVMACHYYVQISPRAAEEVNAMRRENNLVAASDEVIDPFANDPPRMVT